MITLLKAKLHRIELRARMPFRYGIATMTELPHVVLALTFEIDGRAATGIAADHLPPKWFTKDPARAPRDEIDDMLAVIRAAVGHARGVRAATVFGFWRELDAAQSAWAQGAGVVGAAGKAVPPLLAHFGTSLVERALVDAFGRAHGASLVTALQENLFGVELGALRPELAGTAPRDWLPAQPAEKVIARHTVGLSDPLEDGDIPADERVSDGLPQALDACIRFYGLRHFKIKINGEAARDRDRLTRMAGILAHECAGADWAFSLDGNESFKEVGVFADYARGLMAARELKAFWPRLLFIEQPWHRDVALSAAIGDLAKAWPGRPPIIIDESDAELGSLPAALALGYAGTSHKNCKGVFKGVANACRLAQRRAAGETGMLSGEDLSNVGPVALLQDLAVQAALGVTSVERNGHHYFKGLSAWPAAVQAHVLAKHGDVYCAMQGAGGSSWPRVNVVGGEVRIGSLTRAAGLGAEPPPLDGVAVVEL
ncbi:MAG: hypothetical protein H7343_23770 [Undibacterium sp.]|nr:hypothetical protein [Opitutaceae bacterium]